MLVAGKPLDVEHEGQAAPFVADFDGDGKKDLLVGESYKGRLRIYRNVGTNREPRFENYSIFQDGAPGGRISVNCIGFGPDWIDFNGDGIPDILSGSGRQQVIVFRGRPDHTFAAGEPIKDKTGEPLRIDYGLAVFAVDWDNDGKLDLLLGMCGPNGNGVYLLHNEGTKTRPQFSDHKPLLADGKPIQVPGRPPHRQSGPVAADWDGDGKLDLVVGCGDGSVVWYRNIGTREKPAFHAEVLVAAPNGQPETRNHGLSVKICVTDWNEDGRLDLLVGDEGEHFAKSLNDEERKLLDAARATGRHVPQLGDCLSRLSHPARRAGAAIGHRSPGSRKATEVQTRRTRPSRHSPREELRRRGRPFREIADSRPRLGLSEEVGWSPGKTVNGVECHPSWANGR